MSVGEYFLYGRERETERKIYFWFVGVRESVIDGNERKHCVRNRGRLFVKGRENSGTGAKGFFILEI